MTDPIVSQAVLSTTVVVIIQKLKTYLPWLNAETAKNIIPALAAAATALGIHYTYEAGTVMITFTTAGVLHGLWHWVQSMTIQEAMYQGVFHKPNGAPKQ
jgi:hypothetical protein